MEEQIDIKIKKVEDELEKEGASREILYDLSEWFGMPESTEEYISDSQDKPFLACFLNDETVGFVVLNATSKDCADIFCNWHKKFHQIGIGSVLNEAYETTARKPGYAY